MEARNDLPPTRTIRPIDAPPDAANPTAAQLKGDIDSGRTGDKVAVFDPGLSPLGTDDEAAGTPNEPHRVRMARESESKARWSLGRRPAGQAHRRLPGVGFAYAAGIGLIGLIMAAGIFLGRS